jgi:uncharacterized protein with HEPN domain
MHPKSPKWLDGIADARRYIMSEAAGHALADYEGNRRLRYAIERSFEIIGEALLRIERTDPGTAARISDYRKIVGFRNRLAHGYDDLDNPQVWEIIQTFLPILRQEVELLLAREEEG